MTTITIYKSNENGYRRFTCKGHSGFAMSGKDIVCASISILVINTINSLEEITHEEMVVKDDEATGFIDCQFPNRISLQSEVLLDSMILGLKTIAEQYGKYVRLKFEEV